MSKILTNFSINKQIRQIDFMLHRSKSQLNSTDECIPGRGPPAEMPPPRQSRWSRSRSPPPRRSLCPCLPPCIRTQTSSQIYLVILSWAWPLSWNLNMLWCEMNLLDPNREVIRILGALMLMVPLFERRFIYEIFIRGFLVVIDTIPVSRSRSCSLCS